MIMCGRYYIDDSMIGRIEKSLSGINNRLSGKTFSGDIYPTSTAPVISAASDYLQLEENRWGYPGMKEKDVIINARSETVQEKRMFRTGIQHGRIVIPAVHFYEWNPQKTKYTFRREDKALLYLAGITDIFEQERRFVILTTQANASMEKVHDRMPLILEPAQVRDWLLDDKATDSILKQTPVMLDKYTKYEQLTLFDL